MNRITNAIEAARGTIATLPADKQAALDSTLALDFEEHFAYQEAQARAHVEGKLSADEALVIYAALGEIGSASNGGWASDVDAATKYVVTQVIGELLQSRIAAHR